MTTHSTNNSSTSNQRTTRITHAHTSTSSKESTNSVIKDTCSIGSRMTIATISISQSGFSQELKICSSRSRMWGLSPTRSSWWDTATNEGRSKGDGLNQAGKSDCWGCVDHWNVIGECVGVVWRMVDNARGGVSNTAWCTMVGSNNWNCVGICTSYSACKGNLRHLNLKTPQNFLQWAALPTQRLLMTNPPQKWAFPLDLNETWWGNCPVAAVEPPTMTPSHSWSMTGDVRLALSAEETNPMRTTNRNIFVQLTDVREPKRMRFYRQTMGIKIWGGGERVIR